MWTQVQVWASVDTGAAVDVHVSALATPLRWAPPGPGLRLVTAGMWWMTQPAEGGRHLAPIAHGLGDRSLPVSMRTPGEWARERGQLWPTPRSLHPSSRSTGGEGPGTSFPRSDLDLGVPGPEGLRPRLALGSHGQVMRTACPSQDRRTALSPQRPPRPP